MKIRHENPRPDLEYRVQAPLRLELQDGEIVIIQQWSLTGITFPKQSDVLPKKGFLTIPFQGVDIRFPVSFSKAEGDYDLAFKDLTGRQREILGVFYRSILSGKMAAAEDMITSLDTPVDLVPMGETEEEETQGKAKNSPRVFRVIWNVFFYVALAFVLIGLIGGQIWDRLSSVNFANGRVVAPVINHLVTEAAYVDAVLIVAGQNVKRGQTLVRLSNPERDSATDDLRRDIARAQKQTRNARVLLENHLGQSDLHRAPLEAAYRDALSQRRLADFVGNYDLGSVVAAWGALQNFDLELSATLGDFHDIRTKLKTQLDEAKDLERRLKRDLGNAKSSARAMDVVAQADGVVSEIFVFQDEYLARGRIALTLEENTPRRVQAWVDEARADAIYLGMETEITFRNALGKRKLTGVIADITAGLDSETDNGFGMIVTVDVPEMTTDETRELLRVAAPVKLKGLKDWHRFWWAD